MKSKVRQANLDVLNAKLDGKSPDEIILWAAEVFDAPLGLLSAFQKAGCVLCHSIYRLGLADKFHVIFVDTGVNFQETLDTVERFRSEFGLNVRALHPARTMAEQTAQEGVLYVSKPGQLRCCELRKKEPLKQIVGEYEVMLSSLNRSAGGRRSGVPVVAIDSEMDLLRVHPLATQSADDIEAYIRQHNVPYNPLHDQGYPTVSCNRCTSPVLPGEEERAGRWRHLANVEYCMINPTDRARGIDNSEFVELNFKTAEKILSFEI